MYKFGFHNIKLCALVKLNDINYHASLLNLIACQADLQKHIK